MADPRESSESEWAGFSESNTGDGDDDMDFEVSFWMLLLARGGIFGMGDVRRKEGMSM